MDQSSVQARYEAYYRAHLLIHLIRDTLPLVQLLRGIEDTEPGSAAITLQRVRDLAGHLGLDLDSAGGALPDAEGPLAGLAGSATVLRERLEGELRAVPAGVEKARAALVALVAVEEDGLDTGEQIYDACAFLGDDFAPEWVRRIVERWKAEMQWHRGLVHTRRVAPGEIFWVSRDDMAVIDGISRFRFRERFGIGEFAGAFAAVEELVAATLLDDLAGGEYGALAFHLWLAGRSRDLPDRLADVVGVALRRIGALQSPDGSWRHPGRAGLIGRGWPDPSADPYVTALCAVSLLKLGDAEPLRQRGVRAAGWLVDQQQPDGSWRLAEPGDERVVWRPDLVTSLLALEALWRSGIPGIEASLTLGRDWLLRQQGELGLWSDPAFPDPFVTVLVLDLLARSKGMSPALDPYLLLSRGFLRRSARLALEENAVSHQLAITTAFQGLEAFLYGLLSLPSVNVKIFEKPDQTLGVRKALTRFQEHLQQSGALRQGAVVEYRNSLDRLAYLRDEVVHKGLAVAEAECRHLVGDARAFATRYSRQLLGAELLDVP